MGDSQIPREAYEHIKAFLVAGKTGCIQLDIKQGHILSRKLTEYQRAAKEPEPPYNGNISGL
jgi:hypothetical protein